MPEVVDAHLPTIAAPAPTRRAASSARVVYFIASHVNPEQIVRLVRACRSGSERSRVVIHHDYRVSNLEPSMLAGIENVDLLQEQVPIEWGYFTMCQMVLQSMQWLLDHREFDWVVYLTGQDYPLQPVAEIERFLSSTPFEGFIEVKPVEEVPWVIGAQRYLYNYYTLPKFKGWGLVHGPLRRCTQAAIQAGRLPRLLVPQQRAAPPDQFKIGWRPLLGPFGRDFRCYKGSCWWTLNRRCIEYMIRYARQNAKLRRHYQRILFAPNESFFISILKNNPQLNLVTDDNKRYITWSQTETGHPDILRAHDFDTLISSGKHFARKFDQRKDPRILDLLDQHIGIPAVSDHTPVPAR